MRSFLLITGLLAAVTIAFVLGVFVGAGHRSPAPQAPQLAENRDDAASTVSGSTIDGGSETTEQSGPSQQAAAEQASGSAVASDDAAGAGSASGAGGTAAAGDAVSPGDGSAGGDGNTAEQSGESTWLAEATSDPGGTTGEQPPPSEPGAPTVLTDGDTHAGEPVYAVQTREPMTRSRAAAVARQLDGEAVDTRLIPVFAGTDADGTGEYRRHVRMGVFADRATADRAARRAMRQIDARLRVLRVARPEPAAGGDAGSRGGADGEAPETAS